MMSDIKERLRDAVQKLRRTPMSISTLAPLVQQAADHIATLEQESAANLQRALSLEKKVDQLLQHCDDAECYTCGKIICPHEEPLHFHHDGCPACADADTSTQSTDRQNVSINGGNIDISTQEVE